MPVHLAVRLPHIIFVSQMTDHVFNPFIHSSGQQPKLYDRKFASSTGVQNKRAFTYSVTSELDDEGFRNLYVVMMPSLTTPIAIFHQLEDSSFEEDVKVDLDYLTYELSTFVQKPLGTSPEAWRYVCQGLRIIPALSDNDAKSFYECVSLPLPFSPLSWQYTSQVKMNTLITGTRIRSAFMQSLHNDWDAMQNSNSYKTRRIQQLGMFQFRQIVSNATHDPIKIKGAALINNAEDVLFQHLDPSFEFRIVKLSVPFEFKF